MRTPFEVSIWGTVGLFSPHKDTQRGIKNRVHEANEAGPQLGSWLRCACMHALPQVLPQILLLSVHADDWHCFVDYRDIPYSFLRGLSIFSRFNLICVYTDAR
jgi:hypothetical protein